MENMKKTFPLTNLLLQFDHPKQVSTSSEHMYVSLGSARFNPQSFVPILRQCFFRSFCFHCATFFFGKPYRASSFN